jgi:hypothetical protein
MSTPVLINGVTYNIPAYNEVGWGQGSGNLSSFLITVGNSVASKYLVGTNVSSAIPFGSKISSSGTGQYFDITHITLGAGVWSISGQVGFFVGVPAATGVLCSGGIGTAAGNLGSGLVTGDTLLSTLPPVALSDTSVSIVDSIVSLSSPETYYLKALMSFSTNTPAAYGRITAIQIG